MPGDALSSDLRAADGAPPDPPAESAPPQWQTTPVARYGTDTRPLPTVELPPLRRRPRPPSASPPEPAVEPPVAEPEAARVILLVDDEEDVRRDPGPALRRRRVPDRRGGGPGRGGEGGRPPAGAGRPVRPRHRPRHAGLGRRLLPRRLRGGEATLEDEPPPAGADDDGEPQPVAAPARAADGRPVLRLQADPQQAQPAAVRGRPLGLRARSSWPTSCRGWPRRPRRAPPRRPGRPPCRARAECRAPRRGRGAPLRVPAAAAPGAARRAATPTRSPSS